MSPYLAAPRPHAQIALRSILTPPHGAIDIGERGTLDPWREKSKLKQIPTTALAKQAWIIRDPTPGPPQVQNGILDQSLRMQKKVITLVEVVQARARETLQTEWHQAEGNRRVAPAAQRSQAARERRGGEGEGGKERTSETHHTHTHQTHTHHTHA